MTKLPDGWAVAQIGELCDLINGKAFKPSDWTDKGLPIVRIQNLNNPDAPFNHFDGDVPEKFKISDGELLFAWSGTPGTSFGAHVWNGGEAVLNQHIFRVLYDDRIVRRDFFRLAINHKLDELIGKAHGGVGLRHVTKGKFEETEVFVPPIAEQDRILTKISTLFLATNNLSEELSNVPLLIDHYRQGILRKAVSGELTSEWREGKRLEPGDMVSLRDVAETIRYGSSAKSARSGDIPVLRMGNIQDMFLDWSDLVYTSNKQEIEKYLLEEGDVLFNRTNSAELVGKTALYRGERPAIFAGYLIQIRCNDSILPEYLNYCLNSPQGREYCWNVKSDSVSQSNINAKKLAAFSFLLPSLEEQKEIVSRVDRAIAWVMRIEREVASVKQLQTKLTASILQRAFSGRLAHQDPRDEPASVLLERIREERQSQPATRKRSAGGRAGKQPRTTKGAKDMGEKKRSDVTDKHLSELLDRLGGSAVARDLWQKSEMGLDEFYKLLRDEVNAGRIREAENKERLVLGDAA